MGFFFQSVEFGSEQEQKWWRWWGDFISGVRLRLKERNKDDEEEGKRMK
ncbi:hypothetical protein TIFTF001_056358, partial [Ficus carica]